MTKPFRQRLNVLIEPGVLFPAFTLIVLAVIWGGTLYLIDVERTNAEQAAEDSTRIIGVIIH